MNSNNNTSDNQNSSAWNNGKLNPDSPKFRLIRLIVGAVIITLGIVIFNITSKLYSEAEAKENAEKQRKEQKIDSLKRADHIIVDE